MITFDRLQSALTGHLENSSDFWAEFPKFNVLPPMKLKNGLTVYSKPTDLAAFVYYEIFIRQCYTLDFYVPQPRDLVLDAGANIGMFALYLCRLAPGIRLHCFEPSAESRERLSRNIQENGFQENVRIYPFAIFDQCGSRTLNEGVTTCDRSLFLSARTSAASGREIECITIEKVLADIEGCYVDLLKMDVEGSELAILKSLQPDSWARIKRFAIEFHEHIHPGCAKELIAILEQHGFSIRVDADAVDGPPGVGIIRAQRK